MERHDSFKQVLVIEDMCFGGGPGPGEVEPDLGLHLVDPRGLRAFAAASAPLALARRRTGRSTALL